MARIILSILIALSVVLVPQPVAASHPVDCPMMQEAGGAMPHHDPADCCTDECVVIAGAVALPPVAAEAPATDLVESLLWSFAPPVLPSSNPAADDPPPRS